MESKNIFKVKKTIRIQHCDPAGVVFTPQYFNIFVEVVEDWFAEAIGVNFSDLILKSSSGIPVMKIVARFHRPSRLGDLINLSLTVKSLRKSTAVLYITATHNEEKRCIMEFLYGYSGLKTASLAPWPIPIFEKMKEFCM